MTRSTHSYCQSVLHTISGVGRHKKIKSIRAGGSAGFFCFQFFFGCAEVVFCVPVLSKRKKWSCLFISPSFAALLIRSCVFVIDKRVPNEHRNAHLQ